MSDAVLAFHSQLSVVMETVLKAAVFEITRLVEVSFVEEMTQSRQEVEALKQRLQRSERRLMAREGERGARCQDCGKAAVSREASEKAGQRTHSGVEDGCDVKEEKIAKGNRGSCVWEVLDSSPGVSRETAKSRFSRTTDVGATTIITIDLEEEGIDQLHDTEDVKEVTCSAGLQGRLGACLGGTLAAGVALTEEGEAGGTGASPPLSLSVQERDRQGLRGHSCRPKPQSQHTALTPRPAGPLEPAAKRLGLPGSDRTLMDSVTVQQAAFTREPSSPAEGVGSTCSSFGFLSVKAEAGLSESVSLKEEAELLAVCGEDGGSSTVHRQFSEETVPVYVPCVVPLQAGVVRALQSQDTLHSLPGRGSGGTMPVGEGEGGVLHSDAPDENECNLSDGGFTLADGTEVHPREHAEERADVPLKTSL
ncbi:hypothetical protein AGOR_G00186940 [Albula goreensis]|uniref:Uncharacterized protein n=1 Tax=Albula goreensis TaxID=1534307 RepID=A0A8T3CX15_9TELE|nr:hypothetical protein AGOR_G00186940 [Albula goreensis]